MVGRGIAGNLAQGQDGESGKSIVRAQAVRNAATTSALETQSAFAAMQNLHAEGTFYVIRAWPCNRPIVGVLLNVAKTSEPLVLNVRDALHAICSTGKGRCWFCDRRLPALPEALRSGWDVQRIEGERVASIILVCPRCQRNPEGREFPARSLAAGM